MASWDHDGIIELFRHDPRLAAYLLRGPLGVALPVFSEALVEPSTMAELRPAQVHADLVVVLREGARPVLGVIVEVQRKEDAEKLFSWPAYVAWLRRELRAEVCLLVVTQSERVANWASRTIVLGPGGALQPLVLRPSSVPVIDTVEAAQKAPELAVLSALVHGGGPVETAVAVALAASTAAHALHRDQFLLSFGLIHAALGPAARKAFDMQFQGITRFYDESQQQSYNRGRIQSVIDVLEARGLPISDEQRRRIRESNDSDTIDLWVRRAVTIASVDDLFG